jgi:hypothetical protein
MPSTGDVHGPAPFDAGGGVARAMGVTVMAGVVDVAVGDGVAVSAAGAVGEGGPAAAGGLVGDNGVGVPTGAGWQPDMSRPVAKEIVPNNRGTVTNRGDSFSFRITNTILAPLGQMG